MPHSLSSAKFTRIYESLPPEAQKSLVEKHLATLLDVVPKERAKKVVSAATRLQTRCTGVPVLDLKGKKKEINGLLDELIRDSKRSFIKERSHRDELLAEAVDSLVAWLNDIWSVVYEYNVNYTQAHLCLLYAANVLDQINDTRGGCKCSFMNMFVNVTIKKKSGKIVKSFMLAGAHHIDEVLLWIWRDLFVSLSSSGGRRERKKIPEMLADIEDVLGWQALERLLYGGKKSLSDEDNDDTDIDYDESCHEEDSDSEMSNLRCPCHYHASHWSDRINAQRIQIRDLVQARLQAVFEITPSLGLYNSLLSISPDADETSTELLDVLSDIATSCSETLAAALEIHAAESGPEEIVALLDGHSHLLRPRDAPSLQSAVSMLSEYPGFQLRSLEILEQEMLDTARSIRAALQTCFCGIEDDDHKEELGEIIKLRSGSQSRRDRVERWVDAVMTPATSPPHPMAFAAMIMGLPIAPGMLDGDDTDPVGYLDFDHGDPDLEDLREEFRPKLKERFEGWNEIAVTMKGGPGVLIRVYVKVAELMPFLRAPDVVDEMINRLADTPSRHHICDALDTLTAFSKHQRKKISLQARRPQKQTSPTKASSAGAFRTGLPFALNRPGAPSSPPSHIPFPFGIGGMEDVD